ncbi:hypothetical protein P1X14_18950 [Sphingomonas sp. AOB5]|uniref:hypothetical protein n=1 Tax=Sphingomonas sp. AOB5 TaxID=3034017 RepID=UPI0023F77F65|nr:hypothetical protein [Sphingomonas sp. AOB5]MDF7777344.1 hypothetical protein [Sphingomonas sp. AOB5]
MHLDDMHPEDVKALLKKRHGSVARFERLNTLPEKSVYDLLRKRESRRVRAAIEAEISNAASAAVESEFSDSISESSVPHCQNAGA